MKLIVSIAGAGVGALGHRLVGDEVSSSQRLQALTVVVGWFGLS